MLKSVFVHGTFCTLFTSSVVTQLCSLCNLSLRCVSVPLSTKNPSNRSYFSLHIRFIYSPTQTKFWGIVDFVCKFLAHQSLHSLSKVFHFDLSSWFLLAIFWKIQKFCVFRGTGRRKTLDWKTEIWIYIFFFFNIYS